MGNQNNQFFPFQGNMDPNMNQQQNFNQNLNYSLQNQQLFQQTMNPQNLQDQYYGFSNK